MNLVSDLIPWEPLFLLSSIGFVGLAVTIVFRLLRKRRVELLRWFVFAACTIGMAVPWLAVHNFGERLAFGSAQNHVDTATHTPSDLTPRHYDASLPVVHDALVATFDYLGWTIVRRDQTAFYVEVPVARIGLFTDDVTVRLSEQDGTTVNVRSRSRVGRADLGENRRHVVQLFAVLDRYLQD